MLAVSFTFSTKGLNGAFKKGPLENSHQLSTYSIQTQKFHWGWFESITHALILNTQTSVHHKDEDWHLKMCIMFVVTVWFVKELERVSSQDRKVYVQTSICAIIAVQWKRAWKRILDACMSIRMIVFHLCTDYEVVSDPMDASVSYWFESYLVFWCGSLDATAGHSGVEEQQESLLKFLTGAKLFGGVFVRVCVWCWKALWQTSHAAQKFLHDRQKHFDSCSCLLLMYSISCLNIDLHFSCAYWNTERTVYTQLNAKTACTHKANEIDSSGGQPWVWSNALTRKLMHFTKLTFPSYFAI